MGQGLLVSPFQRGEESFRAVAGEAVSKAEARTEAQIRLVWGTVVRKGILNGKVKVKQNLKI